MDDFYDRSIYSSDAATEEEVLLALGLPSEPHCVISKCIIFPLSRQPSAFLVHHHMRNLIKHFEDKIPKHVYQAHFNNWLLTFGLDSIKTSLAVMGRDLDGRKTRRKAA